MKFKSTNNIFPVKIFLGLLFFLFFLSSRPVSAYSYDCYSAGSGDVLDKFLNYILPVGNCRAPLFLKDGVAAVFKGYALYEWEEPGCPKNNLTIEDARNCGDKGFPCYCDSKSGNPDYQCGKVKGAAYIDRPFYYIYHNDGDFEIKGNIGTTGSVTYCLSANTSIRGAGGGFIRFIKDKLYAFLGKTAVFRRGLVFNKASGSFDLGGGTEVSKVKRGKIVATNLAGRKEGVSWKELSPGDWGMDYYRNINSIAGQGGYIYLADKDERRIIRTDEKNATVLGDANWSWTPEDIAVDSDSMIYVASSLNEYNETAVTGFNIINPEDGSAYYAGDRVKVSWNSFPGANAYRLVYGNGKENAEIITAETIANAELKARGNYIFKVEALYNNEVLANSGNELSLFAISKKEQVFRLLYPKNGSVFGLGDTITFYWDRYLGNFKNLNYKLEFKKSGLSTPPVPIVRKDTSYELTIDDENMIGDYEYIVRAYDGDKLLAATNAGALSIAEKSKAESLTLGGNVFRTKIDGSGWRQFLPDQKNEKAVKRFNALKEYLIVANNDPRALSFNEPSGLALSGNYLYIADTGNNRVIRLSKDLSVSADLGDYLIDLKVNNGKDWPAKIAANRKAEAENYWQVYNTGSLSLKNPRDIFIGNSTYIADTENKRVVFRRGNDWISIGGEGFNWEPNQVYAIGDTLYVIDSFNGRIVKIDISDGCNSYFSKGLILKESYFIFGRRGGEKMEWTYPVDMISLSGNFYVVDSVGDFGYSFISGGDNLFSLYSRESNRDIKNSGAPNPFNAEITAPIATAEHLASFGIVDGFNREEDHYIEWTRGEGVSHCPSISSCATTTCLGQWDWDSNAGSCYHYTQGCCEYSSSTPAVCLNTGCCEIKSEDCHVGYSVSFKDYIKPYKEQDLSDDLIYGWMASSTKYTCD
ncbi:MAG: hypothetical protein WC745_05180 [Patescibacteria group bacterium]|jgi:hypothetical protein